MRFRTYLRVLFNSFSSPMYYIEILNAKMSFSWRFFFMSYALLSIISTVLFALIKTPQMRQDITNTAQQIIANYPENLVYNWDKQHLTSNQTSAVEIPFPAALFKYLPRENFSEDLAIIDARTTSPDEVLQEAPKSSTFFVTNDSMYSRSQSDQQWTAQSLSDLPGFGQEFTVNKDTISGQVEQLQTGALQALEVLTILHPVFFFVSNVVLRLLLLLVDTLIIFSLFHLLQKHFPYWKLYQLGLHVIILAETLQLIGTYLFPQSNFDLFGATFWLSFVLIGWQLRQVQMVRLQKMTSTSSKSAAKTKKKKSTEDKE